MVVQTAIPKETSTPSCSRPYRVKLLRAGHSAALGGTARGGCDGLGRERRNGAASDRTEERPTIIRPMSTREAHDR